MTENEFLLQDRLQKIRSIIEQYGEENFYLSFSGGRDSTVLSYILDMAVPNNKIPRVFVDTGIELNAVREFVKSCKEKDIRIVMIKPKNNVREILETYGYPFKSKKHSATLETYQKTKLKSPFVRRYIGIPVEGKPDHLFRDCPKKLRHQFTEDYKLKISDKCCFYLKENPLKEWQENNNKRIAILGILREEGGRRMKATCLAYKGKKIIKFQPFAFLNNEFIDWFITEYKISICKLYNPPYNFKRTGCKGCPFALDLQRNLDVLSNFFPNERKQCELIWEPVYNEYRRLGYRLRKEKTLFD